MQCTLAVSVVRERCHSGRRKCPGVIHQHSHGVCGHSFQKREIIADKLRQFPSFFCRRAAATICPTQACNGIRAGAALSQAGRAGPDQPIRAIQPAGRTRRRRPDVHDRRQTASSLNAPWAGAYIISGHITDTRTSQLKFTLSW